VTQVEVLVIGVGTAGRDAANAARKHTNSVAVIERDKVGGDCIFRACTPTKALVQAARTYKKMKSADFFGLPVINQRIDYRNIKQFKDRIVADTGKGKDQQLINNGIHLFFGSARFLSPHEVAINDEVISADKIIISTGSLPNVPPVPGLQETGYITSVEALELEKVPERLAIIGGGPIGVEFAQIFSSFGSQVHIFEVADRVLSVEDEEISRVITDLFTKQGIESSTSVKIIGTGTAKSGKLLTITDSDGLRTTREFDEIMIATGRKPAVDDLNLPVSGVLADKKGITIDAFMRTNVPHIWAAGDVVGPPLFTYISWRQGDIAGANAVGDHLRMDYSVLPRATFCDPEVASVGLTESQAREKGYKVSTGKFNYADLTKAVISGETDGFIKVVADDDSGQILGAHILGSDASELIHELAAAMANKIPVFEIANTIHSFPTFSEGVCYACQNVKLSVKKVAKSPITVRLYIIR
jgi:dihydrolipoamide dehydrogenase